MNSQDIQRRKGWNELERVSETVVTWLQSMVLRMWGKEGSVCFDVEYIYGFVWWGVCKQSRWRHSVTEPSQDGGYVLLWQRYDNNKMVAMRYYGNVSFCCWRCVYWACYRCILHLQQYSHKLNLLYYLFEIWVENLGASSALTPKKEKSKTEMQGTIER